ncbi:MAG: DUF488 domain-containing protein [Ferruginibacter sp.]
MEPHHKPIWTIGHSTRSIEEFLAMLQSFNIAMVVDVRQFPGSRKFPHFNKEALQISLPQNHIQYRHLVELGGRRKANKESKNIAWRHPAFRSYADYMETESFKEGITLLEEIVIKERTAYMCSEAVWWRCHRSMISDYLKVNGWTVMHIMTIAKAEEHPYTAPAKIVNDALSYE